MTIPLNTFKSPELSAKFVNAYNDSLSLWKAAYESIYVPTDYGRTHILAAGPENGEPLILLNGFGFSAAMWYPNAETLARTYRVYAVDVIGEFNKSEVSRHFREKTDYVKWLTEVMDRLGVERATFIGHSNGGWHALNFAIHAPSRVSRLVLLAPAASFASFSLQFPIRLMAANIIRTRSVIIGFFAKWFVAKGNQVSGFMFEQFYHGIMGFNWKYKILIPSVFSDEELQRIKAPCLMLIGDKEVIYKVPKVIKRAKRLIPHIVTRMIPGAGHALSIEKADAVNQEIVNFLES
ncbi:alpha/beta fold hydrolase [Paenibacillus thermotolerans]|uniref:alpha/beta fold hydrolase n=1 Tax=Paenibacillus thermotolerans TaxID=3027807 RepID=UPI00236898D6|nr:MULTISPECIES: alpha/beta hydrolase [unclassified Paenibacillus]